MFAKFFLEVAADMGLEGASSATFHEEPRGVAATLAAPPPPPPKAEVVEAAAPPPPPPPRGAYKELLRVRDPAATGVDRPEFPPPGVNRPFATLERGRKGWNRTRCQMALCGHRYPCSLV